MSSSTFAPIDVLARALRREREHLGVSVSELAKRAGVAKSTLSQLEAGIGNPSLETLWALASALEVQVSQLIAPPQQPVQVIRAGEGARLASEQADYVVHLLAACPAGARRDIYRVVVEPASIRESAPHPPGTVEHVVLCSGRARLGPVGQCVELGAGDYISYAADVAHVLEAMAEQVTAVMLIEHR
ncbi:TPA: helix-turn-helix transcriptional regulator [Stenotrophomonas maltophilia]|nr:helix-turn-helix transcriptional regulator [Stenotrophomonas maltophilia]